MDLISDERKIKKSLTRFQILSALILFSIYCFILCPIFTYVCNDIIYLNTLLPYILELLIELVDLAAYAVIFAIIIYSVFRFSLRNSRRFIIIFCVSAILKYTANLGVTYLFEKSIESSDISSIIIYFIFDAAIVLIMTLITNSIIKNFYQQASKNRAHSAKLSSVFPFERFFASDNPLQASALASGIVLGITKILSRIIYDLYIGFPQSLIDGMWMAVYYLSDLLKILIVYVISMFVFIKLSQKESNNCDTEKETDGLI